LTGPQTVHSLRRRCLNKTSNKQLFVAGRAQHVWVCDKRATNEQTAFSRVCLVVRPSHP
jgi:hypothetical protein